MDLTDFIMDIMSKQNREKERILKEIFRDKFHADFATLISFAPQDFKCHRFKHREEYFWCDKVIAIFTTSYEWQPEPRIVMDVLR